MSLNAFKIDSPYANFEGTSLSCKLCSCQVKSAKVWTAHVNGKQHRLKLLELKNRKNENEISATSAKRNIKNGEEEGNSFMKKPKMTNDTATTSRTALPVDFFDGGKNGELNKGSNSGKNVEKLKTPKEVPLPTIVAEKPSTSEEKSVEVDSNKSSLPEGFFDDKHLDAKARNVEVKDPLDDEWQKFQKEMQQAQTVTDSIVEEDEEKLNLERTLDEIEEEIRGWQKINELEKKVEKITQPSKHVVDDVPNNNSTEEDDLTLEEMMDWRSKQLWK